MDNVEYLKDRIAEKNSLLDVLSRDNKRNREKIDQVKMELDGLLYRYYKTVVSGSGDLLIAW